MRRLGVLLLSFLIVLPALGRGAGAAPLRLVQSIPLPNVQGRIDHFSVDLEGQRLFMSALGNNTVEVFDLHAGRRINSISGLHEPQGVLYVPEFNKIFVANGEGGAVEIFDGECYRLLGRVDFSDDADNLRYDAATKRVYVGYGDGALGTLDAPSGKRLGHVKLAGHPESFQLEKSSPRIFVNVPTARQIAVIDRDKRVVIARWSIDSDLANFPMALDETDHRLFVVCRKPAELVVFDTESGKVITKLACVGDADDLWYDAVEKRLYVSGGEGFISVIEQRDADHYETKAKTPTASGARTSFFVPELQRLYLAVPHRGRQKAELRIYEVDR